jgi:ketosteroid isomerase-like protein
MTFAQVHAPGKGPSTAETIQQLEHDWADALKTGNTEKLGQILADDWVGIGSNGRRGTKQALLADMKSGKVKLGTIEFGPIDVKELGDIAVVQGSDIEKSTAAGKDSQSVWMDVFVKRRGGWVAVRSQTAKVK